MNYCLIRVYNGSSHSSSANPIQEGKEEIVQAHIHNLRSFFFFFEGLAQDSHCSIYGKQYIMMIIIRMTLIPKGWRQQKDTSCSGGALKLEFLNLLTRSLVKELPIICNINGESERDESWERCIYNSYIYFTLVTQKYISPTALRLILDKPANITPKLNTGNNMREQTRMYT